MCTEELVDQPYGKGLETTWSKVLTIKITRPIILVSGNDHVEIFTTPISDFIKCCVMLDYKKKCLGKIT